MELTKNHNYMQSKKILSEEGRGKLQELISMGFIKYIYRSCYLALIAAEQEIEEKDKEIFDLKNRVEDLNIKIESLESTRLC